MRAVGINSFGNVDCLELLDVPVPHVGPEDVLIQAKTAGTGLWDIKVRKNIDRMGEAELPFPIVLGWESAGIVKQVGANISDLHVGDEVLTYAYQCGNYAEYIAAPAISVAKKPPSLSFEEAAALPINGNTAHQAIYDELKLQPNEVVLITGGAGATGHLAIQLASQLGARVISTTSRRNREYVSTLGADEVIAYDETDFATTIRHQHPDGIDAVLECVDGDNLFQSVKTLKPGGRLVSIVMWDEQQPLPPGIDARYIVGQTSGERLAKVASMVADRKLRVHVQHVFPLEQCREAHRLVEQRHGKGKIILRISE